MANQTFPTNDIHLSAFLSLNSNPPQLTVSGGKVVFNHSADSSLYALLERFNQDAELVPLSRYVSALKSLRSQMLSMRPPR